MDIQTFDFNPLVVPVVVFTIAALLAFWRMEEFAGSVVGGVLLFFAGAAAFLIIAQHYFDNQLSWPVDGLIFICALVLIGIGARSFNESFSDMVGDTIQHTQTE